MTDRRKTERRGAEAAPIGADGGVTQRRAPEKPRIAHSMVDALEDILKWERASERLIKAAGSSN